MDFIESMTASESTTIVECISDAITRRPRADHVKTTPLDWNLIQQKMKARGFDCDATRCELLWKFLSNGELPCRRSRGQKVDPLQSNKEEMVLLSKEEFIKYYSPPHAELVATRDPDENITLLKKPRLGPHPGHSLDMVVPPQVDPAIVRIHPLSFVPPTPPLPTWRGKIGRITESVLINNAGYRTHALTPIPLHLTPMPILRPQPAVQLNTQPTLPSILPSSGVDINNNTVQIRSQDDSQMQNDSQVANDGQDRNQSQPAQEAMIEDSQHAPQPDVTIADNNCNPLQEEASS